MTNQTDVDAAPVQFIVRRPIRHRRSLQAGSRLPDGVVCVTRPGKWGNPFKTAEQFCDVLKKILDGNASEDLGCALADGVHMIYIARAIEELRGKDLACWCPLDAECHAEFLIEFANR